eukprot:3452786-Pyramimonas_sp.AAC.1
MVSGILLLCKLRGFMLRWREYGELIFWGLWPRGREYHVFLRVPRPPREFRQRDSGVLAKTFFGSPPRAFSNA